MTNIRLLLDEDVDLNLVEALRLRGHDVTSAQIVGMREAEDGEVLEWAVRERRAVLTHNTRDYVPLALEYARKGWEHYGIIVSDRVPFKALLARTVRLLGRIHSEDLMNSLEYLQNYK